MQGSAQATEPPSGHLSKIPGADPIYSGCMLLRCLTLLWDDMGCLMGPWHVRIPRVTTASKASSRKRRHTSMDTRPDTRALSRNGDIVPRTVLSISAGNMIMMMIIIIDIIIIIIMKVISDLTSTVPGQPRLPITGPQLPSAASRELLQIPEFLRWC